MKEQKTNQDKEELSRYKKIWYQANKERIAQKRKENKEKITEKNKKYYESNKENLQAYQKEYKKNSKIITICENHLC